MPSTKDPFGEDVSLLYPDNHSDKFAKFTETPCETPIIKGVVNQLRKWPADVMFAFLAACLIIGSLVFLIFLTVAICAPTVVGNRIGGISNLQVGASNAYFFKLDNQNWSTTDYCYIETAARRHPDFNVYLINLIKEEPNKGRLNQPSINGTRLESKLNDSNNYHSWISSREDRLREQLVLANGNIRNVNVSIDKFFKGSKLWKIAKELDDQVLEIAAKAQLLWSVPGVVLKPNMFCNLDSMKSYLCKSIMFCSSNSNKDECLPDKLATIEPENDIQLTGVPCQAFMGFIVQEISKNNHNGKYTLKEAVEKYCPRLYYCPEIRILNSSPKCPTNALNCPIVYSSILTHIT
ncbi:uncharacterized protein LOC117243207 isoform X1 [Bombus vosnesenskii]|uniref:Uncharacterized protein LOC117243207 isoform X1 n=1 Tax=Bombus vosnesenskii TaxID=207650 RepID=A0A6J3LLV1_9HYME|nr:uncharacterized protein LOC117243207 isoform X1 [Bombus vosnesenskii]XP_050489623.1 uncharacterized protein LOC126873115 isoform X1 [Bombus huntii]